LFMLEKKMPEQIDVKMPLLIPWPGALRVAYTPRIYHRLAIFPQKSHEVT